MYHALRTITIKCMNELTRNYFVLITCLNFEFLIINICVVTLNTSKRNFTIFHSGQTYSLGTLYFHVYFKVYN